MTERPAHPWSCDVHPVGCALRFFDAPDNPCRSEAPGDCCYCGRPLTPAQGENDMTMPAVHAATPAQRFEMVPLDQLQESPDNPRQHFDPERLAELVESVKAHGVRTPLLLRPMLVTTKGDPARYEIAAGHRRFRAAQAAGLAAVPAVIQPMDDEEFLELLTFENLQREDVHALEEAEGYRKLLSQKAGYDVARIAERIGKSVKYVYDRMRLLSLITAAQELFRDGIITAGHAILLARLKPEDQERAIDQDTGGLWKPQATLWTPSPKGGLDIADSDEWKTASVRELQGWIDEHVKLDLADEVAPVLFPEALATVATAAEEAEKVVNITYLHQVPHDARDGHRVLSVRSWKRADGVVAKTCEHAVTGVVVIGPGRGDAFKVCTAKKKCSAHWADEQRLERQDATATTGAAGEDRYAEQRKREDERQRKELEAQERWKRKLPEIAAAVATAVRKKPAGAKGPLADLLLDNWSTRPGTEAEKVAKLVPLGTSAEDVVRHCAYLLILRGLHTWDAHRDFPRFAKKVLGIDVAKIVAAPDAVKQEPKAKAAPKKKGARGR